MFDWDVDNIEHIARHNVEPEEAEDALLDEKRLPAPAYDYGGEERHGIIGATGAGRILFVVYTWRGDDVRVISARDGSASQKRRYRR